VTRQSRARHCGFIQPRDRGTPLQIQLGLWFQNAVNPYETAARREASGTGMQPVRLSGCCQGGCGRWSILRWPRMTGLLRAGL
jgi:hypothetical protein